MKINILFHLILKYIEHSIESSFEIVLGNLLVKVKVKINMKEISLKPVMEVMVSDKRGCTTHPLQTNGYNSNRVSENFGPVFSGRRGSLKDKWLYGI